MEYKKLVWGKSNPKSELNNYKKINFELNVQLYIPFLVDHYGLVVLTPVRVAYKFLPLIL